MKKIEKLVISLGILFSLFPISQFVIAEQAEVIDASQCINEDWLFYLGEEDPLTNPEVEWKSVNLPHDWSIETPFTIEGEAESGFLLGGVGWYRKTLRFDEENPPKCVRIRFGGIYMNASLYVNGEFVAYHPYGYTPFYVNLTDYLNFDGSENTLLIKVENTEASSRWYSGSGIYRDVTLYVEDIVSFQPEGIVVVSPRLKRQKEEEVETIVSATVENHTDQEEMVSVISTIYYDGNPISDSSETRLQLLAKQTNTISQALHVKTPNLWSVDDPNLYQLRIEIKQNQTLLDSKEIPFGYRYSEFDANTGFSLNGEPLKIQGVCMHHDQGALGAIENESAIRRQLTLLKEMGVNAIRSTHNPASDTLLRLCNEMGFLVIEELLDTWTMPKNFNFADYSRYFQMPIEANNHLLYAKEGMPWAEFDAKAMVRRGRNHPCIIAWSIGNEVLGNIGGDTSGYPQNARDLIHWIETEDRTRPVTIGNITREDPIQDGIDEALAGANGIVGYNYAKDGFYDEAHAAHPAWKLYGSETASTYGSRGYYQSYGVNNEVHQVSAYDHSTVEWGSTAQDAWYEVISRDFVAGEFIWIGFDYLGEPEPWNGYQVGSVTGTEPSPRSSYFGVLDTCGFPKYAYYFYQSQWNKNVNTLHILPVWNEEAIIKGEDGNVQVVVYSDAASVELFLNGESLGLKSFEPHTTEQGYTYQTYEGDMSLSWSVPFVEGTLEAIAYDAQGNPMENTMGRNVVQTSGASKKILLTTSTEEILADGKALAYIEANILDENNQPVPLANEAITFTTSGIGTFLASDNGDPTDLTSFQSNTRNAFHGKALAIIQSTKEVGTMTITAEAEGLEAASITIDTYLPEPEVVETPTPTPNVIEVETFQDLLIKYPLVIGLWIVFIVLLILFIRSLLRRNRRR